MFNSNLFLVKITKIESSLFLPFLDPANPLYCILIWYIDATYVSGKLGPGRDIPQNENGDESNRKAMNRNWSNQKANPALKTKAINK